MSHYVLALLAMLSSSWAWGHAPVPSDACARPPFSKNIVTAKGDGLTAIKTLCYADAAGNHVLYLMGDKGSGPRGQQLSQSIQIQLYTLSDSARPQAIARDAAADVEAGVAFLPDLIEVGDIDGDGLIDPIIVYRFFLPESERQGGDAYSGRIKIITFYKGQKVVIRAITGMLDGSRSTRATANFFTMPKQAQSHLVKKMEQMYQDREFGFDNSYGFKPRRE